MKYQSGFTHGEGNTGTKVRRSIWIPKKGEIKQEY